MQFTKRQRRKKTKEPNPKPASAFRTRSSFVRPFFYAAHPPDNCHVGFLPLGLVAEIPKRNTTTNIGPQKITQTINLQPWENGHRFRVFSNHNYFSLTPTSLFRFDNKHQPYYRWAFSGSRTFYSGLDFWTCLQRDLSLTFFSLLFYIIIFFSSYIQWASVKAFLDALYFFFLFHFPRRLQVRRLGYRQRGGGELFRVSSAHSFLGSYHVLVPGLLFLSTQGRAKERGRGDKTTCPRVRVRCV